VAAIGMGCIDAINLKPVRVGGLTKAARIRDLCEAAGIMILVDEPQGADLATAGMAQLAASIEPTRFLAASYFMGEHMPISYQAVGTRSGPRYDRGEIRWIDSPGLGVEVDESVFGEPLFSVRAG
jgi:L-alanine-DL-glutamate epimerase-like enolase superfamily enzyme